MANKGRLVYELKGCGGVYAGSQLVCSGDYAIGLEEDQPVHGGILCVTETHPNLTTFPRLTLQLSTGHHVALEITQSGPENGNYLIRVTRLAAAAHPPA